MLQHSTALTRARQRKGGEASGFTLVELLVVIVILGVLAAVTVFAVNGITDNSRQRACEQERRQVRSAAQAYRAQQGSYPANPGVLVTAGYFDEAPTHTFTINGTTGAVSNPC